MKNKNFKKVLPFTVIFLLAISIFFIVKNDFFLYSDYKDSIKISSNSQISSELATELKSINGLVEINNQTYVYQNVDVVNINSKVVDLNTKFNQELIVTEVVPTINNLERVASIISFVLLTFITFVGFSFINKTASYNWNSKEYLKFYTHSFINILVSFILLMGLISLISYFYKINDLVLSSVIFLLILKTFDIWFIKSNIDNSSLFYSNKLYSKFSQKKIMIITLIFVTLLSFGFGVKSVLPLLFLLTVPAISIYTDFAISNLNFNDLKLKNKIELPKFKKQQKEIKTVVVNQPKKAKSKKKKKSKK